MSALEPADRLHEVMLVAYLGYLLSATDKLLSFHRENCYILSSFLSCKTAEESKHKRITTFTEPTGFIISSYYYHVSIIKQFFLTSDKILLNDFQNSWLCEFFVHETLNIYMQSE
jgi:hypothetical protein